MWIRFNNLKKEILKEDENFYLIWFDIIKNRIEYFFLNIFVYAILFYICLYLNISI